MAITDAWTTIAASQVDADSPLNETLFTSIRGNLLHNYDWIGVSYTPADNHSHNGVNSAYIAQGGLKTTTSAVSKTGGTAHLYPTNGGYLFWPQIKNDADTSRDVCWGIWHATDGALAAGDMEITNDDAPGTTYVAAITITAPGAGVTAYAQFRYIQASPPHAFAGCDNWGEFLFLHRRVSDGAILAASQAPDPLWEGAWSPLPKGHPARIATLPHPFADYIAKPLPDGEEIVLVDLRHLNTERHHAPRAAAHAALVARRSEFYSLGLTAAEVAAGEAASQELVEAETAEQQAAADACDSLDATMPRLIDEAPEVHPTLKAVRDRREDYFARTKAQLREIWRSHRGIYRKQAGYLSDIECIKVEAEARGSSLLEMVHHGELRDALAEKEIPKDDRDKLPQCAAFKNKVRVLRASHV